MELPTKVIIESSGKESIEIKPKEDSHLAKQIDMETEKYFALPNTKDEENQPIEILQEEQTVEFVEGFTPLSEFCRTCANISDHLIPIFEEEGLQNDLFNKIQKYLPIELSFNDKLPLQLCYQCAAALLAWHELLEGCLAAESKLQNIHESLQKKQQYSEILTSNGLEVPRETVTSSNPAKPLKEDDRAVVSDSERSSQSRSPFKVYRNMQNAFWKAVRKKRRGEKNFPNDQESDAILIAMLDSTMDQSAALPDRMEIKDETIDIYDNEEKSRIVTNKDKLHEISVLKEKNGKSKSNCKNSSSTDTKDTYKRLKKQESLQVRESYQCGDCGKCFKLKDSFIRHMRIHRDERPFTCHVCGKQFRDSGGLSRHLKDVHAKVKKFTCDICSKSFASKATRDDHRRTHTGERPYICDSCGKCFKSKACLYTHSKLHTDEYPHPCTHCNKRFRRKQEMLAHVTTHTGEKNYGCDVCSKRFRVKSELVRHKLVHSESKPFVCVKCGLAFRQKRYLNNHVKSRHVESLQGC